IHSRLFVSVIRTFPLWSSRVAADHSFAGYCQPFICRLSTSHSQVIHSRHFICSHSHLCPLGIAGRRRPFIRNHSQVIHSRHFVFSVIRTLPLWSSRVTADRSFAGYCQPFIHRLPPTIHSQAFYQPFAAHSFASFCSVIRTFPLWSSRVTADHSFAGYCQPFVRRLFQPSIRRLS